jgi:mono/diheme cytochrome c family protein
MAKPRSSPPFRSIVAPSVARIAGMGFQGLTTGRSSMKFVLGTILAVAAGAAILAPAAVGQTAPDKAKGQAIFDERCKACHDPAVDRAPSREELAARPPADIVAALTSGPMVPVAEGLTPQDKEAVAAYLTAKP